MLIELLEKYIPLAILLAMIICVFFAVKNYKRVKKLRYSGRVSEIIDRRRNYVFLIAASILLLVFFIYKIL